LSATCWVASHCCLPGLVIWLSVIWLSLICHSRFCHSSVPSGFTQGHSRSPLSARCCLFVLGLGWLLSARLLSGLSGLSFWAAFLSSGLPGFWACLGWLCCPLSVCHWVHLGCSSLGCPSGSVLAIGLGYSAVWVWFATTGSVRLGWVCWLTGSVRLPGSGCLSGLGSVPAVWVSLLSGLGWAGPINCLGCLWAGLSVFLHWVSWVRLGWVCCPSVCWVCLSGLGSGCLLSVCPSACLSIWGHSVRSLPACLGSAVAGSSVCLSGLGWGQSGLSAVCCLAVWANRHWAVWAGLGLGCHWAGFTVVRLLSGLSVRQSGWARHCLSGWAAFAGFTIWVNWAVLLGHICQSLGPSLSACPSLGWAQLVSGLLASCLSVWPLGCLSQYCLPSVWVHWAGWAVRPHRLSAGLGWLG